MSMSIVGREHFTNQLGVAHIGGHCAFGPGLTMCWTASLMYQMRRVPHISRWPLPKEQRYATSCFRLLEHLSGGRPYYSMVSQDRPFEMIYYKLIG